MGTKMRPAVGDATTHQKFHAGPAGRESDITVRDLIAAMRAAGWRHWIRWFGGGRREHRWSRGTELIVVEWSPVDGLAGGRFSYTADPDGAAMVGTSVIEARGLTWLWDVAAIHNVLPARGGRAHDILLASLCHIAGVDRADDLMTWLETVQPIRDAAVGIAGDVWHTSRPVDDLMAAVTTHLRAFGWQPGHPWPWPAKYNPHGRG